MTWAADYDLYFSMGDIEALRKENAEQRKQSSSSSPRLRALPSASGELLAVAQRKQQSHGRKASRRRCLPSMPRRDAHFETRPTAPKKPIEEPKPKATTKPTGRNPVPAHLPADEHDLNPAACAGAARRPARRRRHARRTEASRHQRTSASSRRPPNHVPMSTVRKTYHPPLAARVPRKLEGNVRVARMACPIRSSRSSPV